MLGRTRDELLLTTTRKTLLEMMAYDKVFGLPDSPQKIPGTPIFPREMPTGEQQMQMFKAKFG